MLCPGLYHHTMEITQAEQEALLARYSAAMALVEEALVACEEKMTRTAIQKSLHAMQDVRKIYDELDRLRIGL